MRRWRDSINRGWGLGLGLAVIVWSHGSAQHAQEPVAHDMCLIAPEDQLTFVLAGGLGRRFPLRMKREQEQISLLDPGLAGVRCPGLRADLGAEVRYQSGPAATPIIGRLRFSAGIKLQMTFDTATPTRDSPAGALRAAWACVADITVTSLQIPHGPSWLTEASTRALLTTNLVDQACVDVTSLVYVYLKRGGKPGPP